MALRDDMLPILQDVRILFDTLGFRQYDVFLRTIDWDGGAVGKGNKTSSEIQIVHDGYASPAVRRVSQSDVLASAGRYQDQDLRIGPLTPIYDDALAGPGGHLPSYFDSDTQKGRQILFRITGPGMETGGGFFDKIAQETERNWSYYFVVRKSGIKNPI